MSKIIKEVVDKNVIEGTRYFISLVELGSYTAVKNLYSVEINTVRSKLELLEKYLGVKLVQPNSNKIEITRDGKKYYASCHRLYTDLENSILSSKYKGIDNLKYIRIFGTRAFIDFISPKIHQVDESGKYTFTFDSYFLYQANNYFYQLSNYDVAIVTSKDLEKIDQDCWIIAANIDGTIMPSKIYVNQDIYIEYDLKNHPKNIFNVPFIIRRDSSDYDLTINIDGNQLTPSLKHIRYIVEDDIHKAKLIEKGLGAGCLVNKYEHILNLNILPIEGITTETLLQERTVIVSKHLENKTKLVKFFVSKRKNI